MTDRQEIIRAEDAPAIGANVRIVSGVEFPNGKRFSKGELALVVSSRPHGDGVIVTLRTPDGRELPTLHPAIYEILD
jgi:hypothetical protein